MKNFKLLLATTAILSATALMANAYLPTNVEASKEMTVTAEIIKDLNLEVTQHLDFGRISWDFNTSESHSVNLLPDSSGGFTPTYDGVKFHDGGRVGKICFSDLVPGATIVDDFYLSAGSTAEDLIIEDEKGNEIGEIDFSEDTIDAGATDGTRCLYVGAALYFNNTQEAKNFKGKIEKDITLTVVYEAVN